MATLELYINRQADGAHHFIKVDGIRRVEPEGNFKSRSFDQMLKAARLLLEGDGGYEPRLRIYDDSRRFVRAGNTWATLEQLQLWTEPAGGGVVQPRVNESILGRKAA